MIWIRVGLGDAEGPTDERILSGVENDAELDRAIFGAIVELMHEHWPMRPGDIITITEIESP